MAKERALTLEALRVMDAIDRRGSFAAAADELGRVPSALSYTMQKLEEELDVVLFDRSGHRTKFTNVGRMLLERGRVLLEAADKLTTDAEALARGWETHLTLVTEALVPTEALFPLVDRGGEGQYAAVNHHRGAGRRVGTSGDGQGGYCDCAGYALPFLIGNQLAQALQRDERLCCRTQSPDSPGAGAAL